MDGSGGAVGGNAGFDQSGVELMGLASLELAIARGEGDRAGTVGDIDVAHLAVDRFRADGDLLRADGVFPLPGAADIDAPDEQVCQRILVGRA